MSRVSVLLRVVLLLTIACSPQPDPETDVGGATTTEPKAPTTIPATTTSTIRASTISELFDGPTGTEATVQGFLIWDEAGAMLCESLLEATPPMCMPPGLVLTNPEVVGEDLEQAGGVRWSPGPLTLDVFFDGARLAVGDEADIPVPTANEQNLVDAFVEFARSPGPDIAAAIPWAETVSVGLGPEISHEIPEEEVADAGAWIVRAESWRAWTGPFSPLSVIEEPIVLTVGPHMHCASPPVPAPAGYEAHRRISLQPSGAESCLEWWTVDLFLDEDGAVAAVTLDLYEP